MKSARPDPLAPPDLVCAGNLLVDDVVLEDGTTRMAQPGGALLHAALAGAVCGARVGCVSIVGSDYPAEALTALRARGVQLDGVARLEGPGVRVWLLYEFGTRQVVPRLGRPSHEDVSPRPADIPASWRGARALHIAPMPFERQRALSLAASPGTFVSIDPHIPITDDNLAMWAEALARCDALFVGEDELMLSPRHPRPVEAIRAAAGERLRFVARKRGARGGALHDLRDGTTWEWRAVKARTLDPTGAGDAFAAGFVSAWLEGRAVPECLARGAAVASVAVEGDGALALADAEPTEVTVRSRRCVVRAV